MYSFTSLNNEQCLLILSTQITTHNQDELAQIMLFIIFLCVLTIWLPHIQINKSIKKIKWSEFCFSSSHNFFFLAILCAYLITPTVLCTAFDHINMWKASTKPVKNEQNKVIHHLNTCVVVRKRVKLYKNTPENKGKQVLIWNSLLSVQII